LRRAIGMMRHETSLVIIQRDKSNGEVNYLTSSYTTSTQFSS